MNCLIKSIYVSEFWLISLSMSSISSNDFALIQFKFNIIHLHTRTFCKHIFPELIYSTVECIILSSASCSSYCLHWASPDSFAIFSLTCSTCSSSQCHSPTALLSWFHQRQIKSLDHASCRTTIDHCSWLFYQPRWAPLNHASCRPSTPQRTCVH